MTAKTADKENELTLEENFELLKEVTDKLQSEDLPLEEAFENYKRGMDLIKKCNDQIDRVEKEVQMLSANMSAEDLQ